MPAPLFDRHLILQMMGDAGLKDYEIAAILGTTNDKVSKSRKDRALQEPEMALAFQWLLDNCPSLIGEVAAPPSPNHAIPSEEVLANVFRALAQIGLAAPETEGGLRAQAALWRNILQLLARRPAIGDNPEMLAGAVQALAGDSFDPETPPSPS